jgi:tetratricopeptide (TPR) repeat protein
MGDVMKKMILCILVISTAIVVSADAPAQISAQLGASRSIFSSTQLEQSGAGGHSTRFSERNAQLGLITVDYPEAGSIFPPDLAAPVFLWRDSAKSAVVWLIAVRFADGSPPIQAKSRGSRFHLGPIDRRCITKTNKIPKPTPQETADRTWIPNVAIWTAIKRHSVWNPATVTITGFQDKELVHAVSRGHVTLQTSKDPVGAPIFYRDVPLIPTKPRKGVVTPLPHWALPLIAWRLRYVSESHSRLVMTGLHSCANCHSFSLDGKTMGMIMDGPMGDKGMYALLSIKPRTVISNKNVISWSSARYKPLSPQRIGFGAQVSPDGQYVVSMINGTDTYGKHNYYMYFTAAYKDYRFDQTFYPTRGIVAVYSRRTGRLQPLPGADDPRYVQSDPVWSPDGRWIVFCRAKAKNPYPPGWKRPLYADSLNECQIKYDLYRVPFNGGRGGVAEAIAGASRNGMSNSFPKISPDGRWIVFVEAHNGQLLRPSSKLYIVPFKGGRARLMLCNLPLMNSWHSFSPNGRWLVFSSKGRSPYTQMFLTHLDKGGRSSPPILIENATAANRAVNIPEFLNIKPDGLVSIRAPVTDEYALDDRAMQLLKKGQYAAAIAEWEEILRMDPGDAKAENNIGSVLMREGKLEEAITHFERALQLHNPDAGQVHDNIGVVLMQERKLSEAMGQFEKALELNPYSDQAHLDLGIALAQEGRLDDAIAQFEKALMLNPDSDRAHDDIGITLMQEKKLDEAIPHFQEALKINSRNPKAHFNLGYAYYSQGRIPEALAQWHQGLRIAPDNLPVLNQTAWVLATYPEASVRNGTEAVKLAEQASQLTGGRDPEVLDTLAAAYAQAGRFPKAVETAQQGLALAMQQGKQRLAKALRDRITLYGANTPLRERLPTLASHPEAR